MVDAGVSYMYTHIHAYIHTCIHTYMHAYMYTHIHAYIHVYTHTCIHTCIHIYMYVCMYIHTNLTNLTILTPQRPSTVPNTQRCLVTAMDVRDSDFLKLVLQCAGAEILLPDPSVSVCMYIFTYIDPAPRSLCKCMYVCMYVCIYIHRPSF